MASTLNRALVRKVGNPERCAPITRQVDDAYQHGQWIAPDRHQRGVGPMPLVCRCCRSGNGFRLATAG